MKYKLMFILVFMAFSVSPAVADTLTDQIQKSYENVKSFSADFSQTLTNAASGEQEIRKGQILFKQPSLMSWESISPEKEKLVVGKECVWDYFVDEELALKYRKEQVFNSKTMIKFISGKANLNDDFIVENQGEDRGMVKLKLQPIEPEPSLVLAYGWVDNDTKMLKSILVVDFYGNGNQVDLSNLKLNVKIDDKVFEFTPPKGVEVEDNTNK